MKKKVVIEDIATAQGKMSTRLLAALADAFIMIIAGVCLYTWVGFPIAKASTSYDANIVRAKEIDSELGDILVNNHLLEYNTDPDSSNTYRDIKAIYKDYAIIKISKSTDIEDDMFSNYYVNLRAKDKMTVSDFNLHILKLSPIGEDGLPEVSTEETVTMFDYYKDEFGIYDYTKIGVLDDTFALYLSDYLVSGDEYAEAVEADKSFTSFFLETWNGAYEDVYTKDDVFHALKDENTSINEVQKWIVSVTAIIMYIIAMIIFYLVIPLCFANGATIAKKIMKLGLSDRNGYVVMKREIIARFIVILVELIGTVTLFPMFIVGIFDIWSLPFLPFVNATISMSAVLVTSAILIVASIIIMLVTARNTSLHDLASHTMVIAPQESIIFKTKQEKDDYFEKLRIDKEKKARGETSGE